MEKIALDDVDGRITMASRKLPVGSALGAEQVAMNYYEVAPGEYVSFGYHAHSDQEELFYVLEGEATFETESGDVTVGADEAIRFAPGEFQRGRNEGDSRVRALAVGAPADPGELTLRRPCEACGDRTDHEIERVEGGETLRTVCLECGTETGRFV
jgi:uncharacterized cupin superfamily protein